MKLLSNNFHTLWIKDQFWNIWNIIISLSSWKLFYVQYLYLLLFSKEPINSYYSWKTHWCHFFFSFTVSLIWNIFFVINHCLIDLKISAMFQEMFSYKNSIKYEKFEILTDKWINKNYDFQGFWCRRINSRKNEEN